MAMRAVRFFSFLILAIFVSAPLATAQERRIELTQDGDYFGFDLRTEKDVSLEQCSAACLGDQQCRAFTYNTSASWCFLKSDYAFINPFPGAVAGRAVPTTGEPDIGAPPELAFLPDNVHDEAIRYRADIAAEPRPDPGMGVGVLTTIGENALNSGNSREAVQAFREALRINADARPVWSQLTTALLAVTTENSFEKGAFARAGTSAALNAYQLTRGTNERAEALADMARALDNRDLYRPAISAYNASLELVNSAAVRAEMEDLRARKGFRVVDHTVNSDTVSPRICLQFSEALVKTGTDYASFVTVDGRAPKAVDAGERQLCVEGLDHAEYYDIVVRSGLPSAIGEVIASPITLNIYVRDRSPSLRFTGENFVLPSTARRGIPLISVNTETAELKLYRVGDRALTQLLSGFRFLSQLDGYGLTEVGEQLGQPVWTGEIDIRSELNSDVTTSFPVDEALPEREPGVYVLSATPKGEQADYWNAKATQWFVVSDIGLTTFTGADGLTVFARSLASAQPLEGAELTLLARNNEVLGTATTDAAGQAKFTPGLTRGTGSLAPAALLAKNSGGDFVFLDMTRAGFDLSERGVTGRAAPGALDVFSWTERGIYRAGETVHAAALARDDAAVAVENLPLTFIFTRPDGVEDRRIVDNGAALGGYAVELELQANAMRGTWNYRIHADPDKTSVASGRFLVEDFVPDRIEFDLSSPDSEIVVGEPALVEVDGRFLYGAPASGLAMEGEVALTTTREWEAFPGYQFGLADEQTNEYANVTPLSDLPVTDDNGKANFEVFVNAIPSTTQRINANVVVRMREGAGRAVERSLVVGVVSETDLIGVRPEFTDGSVPEGAIASFRVIGASADGERMEMDGLIWTLEKLERSYQWYRNGSSWYYEPITYETKVADGRLDVGADAEGRIQSAVQWGRYRLTVETPDPAGPQTSVEFDAGWYVAASSTETPDGLEIALDKEEYAPGETARLQISPRFAGEVLVTVGADRLLETITASVPEGGATIDIPVSENWGAGAYVTATLFRPGDAEETRMPARAIGLKWLSVDPGPRKLDVALEAPAQSKPRGPLTVPISVPGAAGETAYVALAAVDVGILNLTNYEAPDPSGWYYGQRRLGLELRDLYGRLIDGSLGVTGRLRTGGDGGGMAAEGSPPTEELVAFFTGPVELDNDGRAIVAFDIPQFNGTVRLMAVAWTKDAVGNAETDVIVREPVVVTAGLPRFMAPGDTATLRLDIANTDGPAGDYSLEVVTDGRVAATFADAITFASGERKSVTVPLTAERTGRSAITVQLAHADGTTVEHALSIPVRPSAMPVTTRRIVSLAANGGSIRVDEELLGDSLLDGASVSIGVSPVAAFDIPSLLVSLDRYPYGCAEQTTSRALPLLYVAELAAQSGLDPDPEIEKRVQDAILRVLSYQSSSGSFGLWAPGWGDLWLDSYVTEFLTRARELDYQVPEQGMRLALDNLQNSISYDLDIQERGAEIGYALYVLARNRRASAGDLRYYADTRLDEFDTPMARAQIAASLALYGDTLRAERAFRSSLELAHSGQSDAYRSDYGSALRDGAAILALAAETRPVPGMVPEMISFAAEASRVDRYLSTQEQAWMLLAARALMEGSEALQLEINGSPHMGGYATELEGLALPGKPVTIVNRGSAAVDAVVTTVAAPAEPLPAGGEGFAIERNYYNLDGSPANASSVAQNERLVVVLKVTEQNDWGSRVLVTDLLPGGFEIDNPSLVSSAELKNFEWLPNTDYAHAEFRDDRFVAAFDRSGGSDREIVMAYVVRAVTPGVYAHPAANVEDMYRPQFRARTADGFMEVVAP
ncbi:MAG: alpha-2-macroglobulin family protein [Rhizobiaceae bacterium]|nr:alpha-2-macroglobulin family protein [Rhizobiaceae bacterium]